MYKLDFNQKIHVYFCGIGGISMSGMAELLHSKGFTITGSDQTRNKTTEHLESLGINIIYEQTGENITKNSSNIDLIVYTAAIKSDNAEFITAKASGIPMLTRAQMMGQIMSNYKNAISVAGTHGKTTTTSMLSMILLEGDQDPTISVGGVLDAISGNIRIGGNETFIVESCEYTNSFLSFKPTRSIILNVEAEHLDFFKDLEDVRHSFQSFIELLPNNGTLVINGEIENYKGLLNTATCKVITYGIKPNKDNDVYDYSAKNISYNERGCGMYDLYYQNTFVANIELAIVGEHNVSNSLSAIAMALDMGISMECIKSALLKYTGTHRRFEKKGEYNGVTIIDDYAHHPTEISATLTAAKNYPHKELWCAFQPHTYTRTKNFLKEFAEALSVVDHIVLADIYAAREKDPGDISSKDLQRELEKLGKDVHYFGSFREIEDFLIAYCTNGDMLKTMGAGNIVSVGENILSK